MNICGVSWRIVVLAAGVLALGAGVAQPARAFGGCPDYALSKPFSPWLDPAHYTLAPNGGLESGSKDWALEGAAKVVRGNERFYVRSSSDRSSLSLPSGSSATTSSTCVTLLDPTMRLFAVNTGSPLSTLKVEVLYTGLFGMPQAVPVALLVSTSSWQPTPPVALLANVTNVPLATSGKVDVRFRFTPQGSAGDWSIDDVYVDPFKGN